MMRRILSVVLPAQVDNTIRGIRLPVYVFVLIALVSAIRSCIHLFAPDGGAGSIAGIDLVYRHGGEIDRYRGDGLVAFFGVKAAHEDDPERAVRAALAMQEAVKAYAVELRAERSIDFRGSVENQDIIVGRGRLDGADRVFPRMEGVGDQVAALCSADMALASPDGLLNADPAENAGRSLHPLAPRWHHRYLGQYRMYIPLASRMVRRADSSML